MTPCRAGKNEGKFTYTVDGHTFNFLAKGGFSKIVHSPESDHDSDSHLPPNRSAPAFLCVADEAYGRAIPSEFLNRMNTEFAAKFADKGGAWDPTPDLVQCH